MASQVATRVVQIIARIQIKRNGIVVYKVRSSNGVDIYDVTVVRGKVNNCTCPSKKPCYHWAGIQARENARAEAIAAEAEQANMQKLADHRVGDFYEQRAKDIERTRLLNYELGIGA